MIRLPSVRASAATSVQASRPEHNPDRAVLQDGSRVAERLSVGSRQLHRTLSSPRRKPFDGSPSVFHQAREWCSTTGRSMRTFEELQTDLGPVWSLNRPGSSVEHVVVVLPSFSMGESLLSHYATRIPALEHRYLVTSLMLHRIESCELVFLTCQAPDSRVLDYYASLLPRDQRSSARTRFRLAVVPDDSARPIAAKLLDRPDLMAALRASFAESAGLHRTVERYTT